MYIMSFISGVGGPVKGMFIRFFAKLEIVVFTLKKKK